VRAREEIAGENRKMRYEPEFTSVYAFITISHDGSSFCIILLSLCRELGGSSRNRAAVLSMETLQTTTRRQRAELFESEGLHGRIPYRQHSLGNEIRELAMGGGFIEPAIPQVGQVQPLNAVL
jgi:hypothetical protein